MAAILLEPPWSYGEEDGHEQDLLDVKEGEVADDPEAEAPADAVAPAVEVEAAENGMGPRATDHASRPGGPMSQKVG